MVATYKIILPYELGYVGNKEADKRRKVVCTPFDRTGSWLR
jgi:hypothetical protein